MTRREFIVSAAGAGLFAVAPRAFGEGEKPLRFLFMADLHVESDFVEGHGETAGQPVYTMWKPGNHAAIARTFDFINRDPFCSACDFALFGGDQLNTGYTKNVKDRTDELANYNRLLEGLDLHAKTRGKTADLGFVAAPFTVRENLGKGNRPYRVEPKDPVSRVIAFQGNHDTGVDEFYRDCAFTAGGVRFITFFASYVGLPPTPKYRFNSTAKISDETIAFIAREMEKAHADPKIRSIVLASHWAIAPKSRDFVHPILGPCPENKMNDNRAKLLALAEKYGCRLYINGHEHNGRYPVAKAGVMADINCGSLTSVKGAFAVFELHRDRADVHIYSRAVAEERDGKVVFTAEPQRLETKTIPFAPAAE